jgi:phage shock protein E
VHLSRPAVPVAALLTVLALAGGGLLAGCSSTGSTPAPGAATSVNGVVHVEVPGFAALVSSPGTVVLDVRTPQEFAAGHLAGARNLDISAPDFSNQLAALDRSATYAVYCHSGNRSGQALQAMSAAGFGHVADLSGGITAWSEAGRSVTTG